MAVLVTGATGYIGGRLIPRLLEKGYEVRVLVRDPEQLSGKRWANSVDAAVGDVLDRDSLKSVLRDIDAAYYLIHSMEAGKDFTAMDRWAASNFATVGCNLKHVIYLGGLLPKGDKVSRHLASRFEVGEILRSVLPTTELRAGPIIGSGSASFEMVRYLTERIPFMIAPNWIDHGVQPIAIRDILQYLILALERKALGIVEVGSDRITYRDMLEIYATVRGLPKRRIWVVPPFLPPRIATLWFQLVTPLPNSLALPLIEGIALPVVADTTKALREFPEIRPLTYRTAVALALERIERRAVETRWSGAVGRQASARHEDREGCIRQVERVYVDLPPDAVFRSFSCVGGDRGWLTWEWFWKIRGAIDKVLGGPGLRRGRRHPSELHAGEAVDFWRVEKIKVPEMLRLRSEMKTPGQAWLQWEVKAKGSGTLLTQKAVFVPFGLWGTLYWYSLYPVYHLIHCSLARAIAKEAEAYLVAAQQHDHETEELNLSTSSAQSDQEIAS